MLQTANLKLRLAKTRLCLTLAFVVLGTSQAFAHDLQESYEMTVIRDAAFGRKVTSGKYEEAIARIRASKVRASRQFFSSNNLCVAYTKSNMINAALDACNDALASLKADLPLEPTARNHIERKYLAMAFSNRGVLRAVSGDEQSARDDFNAAVSLDAGLSAPARNLALLDLAEIVAGRQ